MRNTSAFFILSAIFGTAVLFACSASSSDAGPECKTGDTAECKCASGAISIATCEGTTFGTCACTAAEGGGTEGGADGGLGEGGSGGGDGGLNTSDAAFGQYLGPCNKMDDCPDGDICFQFGTKGLVCTKMCNDSTMCPPPSPKCNPRMVCAPPD